MRSGLQVQIRPARESDTASLCDAVLAIASEKWFLATVDGFSFEETSAFLKRIGEESLPQATAVVGDQVVGFCDIIPNSKPLAFGGKGSRSAAESWKTAIRT